MGSSELGYLSIVPFSGLTVFLFILAISSALLLTHSECPSELFSETGRFGIILSSSFLSGSMDAEKLSTDQPPPRTHSLSFLFAHTLIFDRRLSIPCISLKLHCKKVTPPWTG